MQSSIVKTSLAGFNAGNIISDAVFTNKSTMTEAQIQSFFNSKVSKCVVGKDENGKPFVCLKDFKITSVNRQADAYCSGYKGAANESAARIIYRVAQACNINPQVLIVMLQKEQGLVTHVWPSAWRYNIALGQGCPDTAPCDPNYIGFFHQIYGAARQMQMYMEGRWFTWYAPGKTWGILYHPNASCGRGNVYVSNKATAALYYYTPYQPNAAALRANYGEGDRCSSYGNRNFYNYFTDWFGSTTATPSPAGSTFTANPPSVSGYVLPGQRLTATPRFSPEPQSVTYQWLRDSQPISGATGARYDVVASDAGTTLSVKVTAKRSGYTDATAESTRYAVSSVTVDRAAGADREQTAVAASQRAWPSGASIVYLATSRDFADALTTAPAANRAGGALLLTAPDALSDAVERELKRLAPTRITLLGGPAVLSDRLLERVKTVVPAASISRLFGTDRYATSRAVAESTGSSDSVLVATGSDFPDALSAAAAGSSARQPVLLVKGSSNAVDADTRATIAKLGASKVTIVGGTGVVSSALEGSLRSLGLTVTRLSGSDRYETNVAVNRSYFPGSALTALIASGNDFPDALSASALAGRMAVPLLLSQRECIRTGAADFLRERGTTRITLVGGTGVLTKDGVEQLQQCG
ncbi:cell wall-binding repeat-containing protein [Microbacterium aerolatum]|uniref:cell wall-binding repeat-containing protein n=1 Tax=Microbacterium aerolatum TaxID=153731 RepID=UPI0020017D8A|nr:cell wall-binding repeat-containing protein [Microbacterium aerolatum]MCK3770192.1 cell wall-binding repeat-containing protein [Microbacterium aerolatum]